MRITTMLVRGKRMACSRRARRTDSGPRYPPPREKQREPQVNEARRYPHDQASKLLVLKRRQPAQGCELLLFRIPGLARQREKNAEDGAMQAGEEQARDRHAVAARARRSIEQRPPEQE